jgi:hypothetical protein
LKNISVLDIPPEDNNGNPSDPDPELSEDDIEPRDGSGQSYYITLTVTSSTETYLTTLLLGDSFPTSIESNPTPDPTPTPQPQSALATPSPVQHPGISTGAIAGIIVGVLAGLSLLVGAFYVYLVRSKILRKGRRRRGGKRRSPRVRAGEFFSSFL